MWDFSEKWLNSLMTVSKWETGNTQDTSIHSYLIH